MKLDAILRRMKKSKLFLIGLIGLILIVGVCLLSPLFMPHDPNQATLVKRLSEPDWFSGGGLGGNPFGTDPLGRDVLSRLLEGGRVSLLISVSVVVISSLIGTLVGLFAGYFGGVVDRLLMRICDMLMAIPALILAICVVAVLGTNLFNLIATLCIASWVTSARLVRATVLSIRGKEYVLAARVMGMKNGTIIMKEVLPNTLTPILISCTQRFGSTILVEASMSYLGMGVPVPTPSWGNMISDGREYLATAPWVVIIPGVALMLTVLCFNFLGDGLRDIFDPKNTD